MNFLPARTLLFVAHPDDLEPQAGGTVLRMVDEGSEVHLVTAIVPVLAPDGALIAGAKTRRKIEALEAARKLGINGRILNLDPRFFWYNQDTIQIFDRIAAEVEPDLIITHGLADTQQDHVVLARIARTVCRRNRIGLWEMGHSFPGGWRSDRLQENLFVDITGYQERKMEAVRAYKSQVDRYGPNWLDGIEARDRYYGSMLGLNGEGGVRYAEAFRVEKLVWL